MWVHTCTHRCSFMARSHSRAFFFLRMCNLSHLSDPECCYETLTGEQRPPTCMHAEIKLINLHSWAAAILNWRSCLLLSHQSFCESTLAMYQTQCRKNIIENENDLAAARLKAVLSTKLWFHNLVLPHISLLAPPRVWNQPPHYWEP